MPNKPTIQRSVQLFALFVVAMVAKLMMSLSHLITRIPGGRIAPAKKRKRVRKNGERPSILSEPVEEDTPGEPERNESVQTTPPVLDYQETDATWTFVHRTRTKENKQALTLFSLSRKPHDLAVALRDNEVLDLSCDMKSEVNALSLDVATRPLSASTEMDDSISALTVSVSDGSSVADRTPVLRSPYHLVPVNRLPPCYQLDPYLHALLDEMSNIFNHSAIDGYVFGSTNYKQIERPNDFDVLLVNIHTDQDQAHVDGLIECFKRQGGVVTATDERGLDGYRTGNRHVIPMLWNQWKIDFIVSTVDVVEHSQRMDFTIGALYFNLRQKKMYRVAPLKTIHDLDRKRLCTVIDPEVSFAEDPSRIFRAVRLMVAEQFHLSEVSDRAIRTLFAGDKNPFNSMKTGKLFQQLQLLWSSGHAHENIDIFFHLGLFFKLFSRVHALARQGGYRYLSRLQPYYDAYTSPLRAPQVLFVPYIVPSCFVVPYPLQKPLSSDALYPGSASFNGR